MPYPFHLDTGIDEEKVKVLFEVHVSKTKSAIWTVDRWRRIDLVINPYFVIDDPVSERFDKIGGT